MNEEEAKKRLKQEIKKSGLTKRKWYRKVYLKSIHWKKLRIALFIYIGKKQCAKCKYNKFIQVHHIRYKNIYDVTIYDLQPLCKRCHKKEHTKKKYGNTNKNIP